MKRTRFVQLFTALTAALSSSVVPQAWADTAAQMQSDLTTAIGKLSKAYTRGDVYVLTFTVASYSNTNQTILQLLPCSTSGTNAGDDGLYLIKPAQGSTTNVFLSADDNKPRTYKTDAQATARLKATSTGTTNVYTVNATAASSSTGGIQFDNYGIFNQGNGGSGTVTPTNATYTVAYDGTKTTIMMEVGGVTNRIEVANANSILPNGFDLNHITFYSEDKGATTDTAISNGSFSSLTNVYTWNGAGSSASWNTSSWKLGAADGQNYVNGYDVEFVSTGAATATVNSDTTVGSISAKATKAIEIANGTKLSLNGTITAAASETLTVGNVGSSNTMAFSGGTFTFNNGSGTSFDGTNTLVDNATLAVSGTAGTMTVTNGSLGKGAKFTFGGGASYVLNGAFSVEADPGEGPVGPTENGFLTSSYSVTVVEGTATNNATWTVNGLAGTYNNGVVTAEGVSYDTYYVIKDEVAASDINTAAEGHTAEFKTVALSGGNLVLDASIAPAKLNVTGGSISMSGGSAEGTVNLVDNTILNISGDTGSLAFTGGTLGDGAKFNFNGNATYTLSGLYEVQGGTGGGGRIIPTGNGFASGTLSADVVVGTGTVNASGATWKLNGMDASYDSGTISTAAGTLYDIYYVQSGTASVTGITQAAGTHASELQTVALNNGTLSLNDNLANQTIIAQNGTTIDAGTAAVTRNIKDLELASGATVTMQGGGSGSTGAAVANINIGTLGVESGNATLVVNQNQSDNYMNIDLHVTDTVVGDNAKLTVKGQSGKQDNSLGAITLGKNAQLELAGHRSSGQSRRFAMTINGGTLDEGAKIVISNDSTQGGSTQATYTVTGAFDVTAADSDYSNIQAPRTGNGFATGSVTTTVLQKSSGLSSNVAVTVNGTWTLNGANATYNNNNGSISASNVKYYQTYYMRQNTQSVSGIMAEAGKYASKVTTVDLSGGTLQLDSLVSTVNATGGTLAFVGETGADTTVNVNDDINVTGDTNPEGKTYKIAAQKTITFDEDLEMQGVSFVGEGGTKVTIQNTNPTGGAAIQYSLDNSSALLSADKITVTDAATTNVNIGNQVAAATVENQSTNSLTLAGGDSTVEHVIAAKGNIVFHNMVDAITLESMIIGEGKQVGVYSGSAETTAAEATVSISNTLKAGAGSSLLANLNLGGGSYLDLDGRQMNLGGTLTMQPGSITLDEATLAGIAGLKDIGDSWVLFQAAPGTTLSFEGVESGSWARDYFDLSSISNADYQIVATDNVFSIQKVSNVPEPTTGTLSLLALAALAARRRRK